MQLIVLGCYGPYPHIDGACSGYLLQTEHASILLDLGNGTLRNCLRHITIESVDAVFLSHLHPDHISDVFVLRYMLEMKKLTKKLYAPKEPQESFEHLSYKNAFEVNVSDDKTILIKDMKITLCKMHHAIPSYAIKVESEGKTFVYSGDTGYNEKLEAFAQDCDLLLCEAAVSDTDIKRKEFHMSATQGCELAEKAKCKRLLVTHFFPEYKHEMYLYEIEKFRPRLAVETAKENNTYTV